MAFVKTFKIISAGAGTVVKLGFVPSRIDIVNFTTYNSAAAGLLQASWYNTMPNGSGLVFTNGAGGAITSAYASGAGGVTPFQSSDSVLWTNTSRIVTGISSGAQAQVTSVAHGFTANDVGVTTVTFSGVIGMSQINTLRGTIQSIVDADHFTVNINTSSFSDYVSGGQANVITGIPPFTQDGYQIFNTPQKNKGIIGVILGSAVSGVSGNSLLITAFLDADFTS